MERRALRTKKEKLREHLLKNQMEREAREADRVFWAKRAEEESSAMADHFDHVVSFRAWKESNVPHPPWRIYFHLESFDAMPFEVWDYRRTSFRLFCLKHVRERFRDMVDHFKTRPKVVKIPRPYTSLPPSPTVEEIGSGSSKIFTAFIVFGVIIGALHFPTK